MAMNEDTNRLKDEWGSMGGTDSRAVLIAAHASVLEGDPSAYTRMSPEEVKVVGKERSEDICKKYSQDLSYVPKNAPGDIATIVGSQSMQMPSLDDIGTAGKSVASAHDPNVNFREFIESQIEDIVGTPASNLAGPAITKCVGTVSSVVKGLDTSDDTNVKVVQNREFEFDAKIKEDTEIDDRAKTQEAAGNFEGALDLEVAGQKAGFETNTHILADADAVRNNMDYDVQNLDHDVDAKIDDAHNVNKEGKSKWTAVRESLRSDLAEMNDNIANIDVESGIIDKVIAEKQASFETRLQEITKKNQVMIHEMGGGLFNILAADLQLCRADTTNANEYHISGEVHTNCTYTLTKLRDVCVDQVNRHKKALGVVNSIVAAHDRIEDLLQTVREIVKAEYKKRLNGPIPTPDAQYGIISNRKYERVLLKKSVELLFAVLPRDYRVVQAKVDDVKVKNIELETTKKKLKVAYQLKDRTKMAKHQARINELKEELVTSEANLAEENARFEQCVIETRYEESRRRLIEEYGETEETIGKSALQVVKDMPPSDLTIDLEAHLDQASLLSLTYS